MHHVLPDGERDLVGAPGLEGRALRVLVAVGIGLGLLVAAPMFVISTYVGYREVFEAKPVG